MLVACPEDETSNLSGLGYTGRLGSERVMNGFGLADRRRPDGRLLLICHAKTIRFLSCDYGLERNWAGAVLVSVSFGAQDAGSVALYGAATCPDTVTWDG